MRHFGKMMRELLHSLFLKPATTLYPAVKVEMPPRFRGKLAFYPERCICCKMCVRDCPTGAIQIRKVAEKQFEADIDLSKCIYCAQCVDSCPKKALEATGEFELAQLQHDKLRVTYRAEPKERPLAGVATEPKADTPATATVTATAKPDEPKPEVEPQKKP
jgi:formate hydrogenlyase subunit 6/NADH:ubiquinone oxidoreductase subunit I